MNIFDRLAALARKFKRNKTPEAPLEVTAERISRSQFTSMPPRPEFQTKLLEQLQRARRNQSTPMVDRTSRFITGLIRSLTAVPILASVVVVAMLVSTVAPLGTGLHQVSELLIPAAYASDNFTIDPTVGDRLGVASSTSFVVTSKTPLKAKELERALHLVPALEYSLTEKSPTEFVVTPRTALAPRTLYRIIIDSKVADEAGIMVTRPFSFAFEVKEKVRVITSIPGDKTTGVPVKTAIEFTLSHDGLDNTTEAITVAPAFKYVVETKGRKLIVKPQELLKMGTIYTVKLSKNLRIASSTETLGTDYVVSFETERATDVERDWYLNERVVEFSPEQKAFLPVYGLDAKTISADFNATVYRFASPEAYAKELMKYEQVPYWSWFQRNSYVVTTSSLARAFQTPLVVEQGEYGDTNLRFPNKLTVGWYVANITAAKKTRQVLFQVTPWGVFSTNAAGKIVLWVNNLLTQTPAVSANVATVSGTIMGTTNAQGVVQLVERDVFSSTSTFQTAYVVVGAGSNAVVVGIGQNSGIVPYDDMRPMGNSYSDYWRYITTDRQVYKTGDTAQVWGFVAPREKGAAKPTEVRLKLLGNGTDWYGNQQVIVDKKVPLTAGSFSTSFSLATLGTGSYTLQTFVGETLVSSQYIRVEKYEKPVLTLALTPSTYAVHTNEKFTATVRGTFFDGTPAARLPVSYQFDNQSGVVMLDDAGRATISLIAPYENCRTPVEPDQVPSGCYLPKKEWITVRPQSGEYGDVQETDGIAIFGANAYINGINSAMISSSSNVVEVSTTLYTIDTSRVKSHITNFLEEEGVLPAFLTTPVPGALMDGILTQTVYVKVSQGTIYNSYTKQMEEQFTTVASTTVVERFTERTNSNGQLIKRFSTRPDVNYTLYLRTIDSKGYPEYARTHFYGQSLSALKQSNNPSYQPYGGISLKLAEKNKEYVVGEEARIVMTTDEDKPISTSGKNLFLRSNGRYLEAEVRSDTTYAFGFTESDIPTTYVLAARLSGNDYQTMSYPGLPINFKKETRALTVSVTSTKPTYAPGEQAMVVVNVRDAEGNPVIGAVNLNIVDEAYYAFNPESARPLEVLYTIPGSPFTFPHRSHELLKAQNLSLRDGFGGGGDEGSDRTNFVDTAATLSGVTNADGEAVFTVKLPDNITSWRATAQVITEKILAGASTTPIIVTKPVFVQPAIAPSYVAGDKPVLAVQAYGTGLQQNDTFQLGFSAPSLGMTETIESGAPFTPRYVALPQLTAGVYETRLSVTAPRGNDAVRLPLTVVPSRQREQVEKTYDVTPGTTIVGSAFGPTTITVMDKERGSLYGDLLTASYESSNRLDDRLAAVVAQRALQTYFGDKTTSATSSFERYQTVNRGMALVPYGGSDQYLTMLASIAHTDGVDTAGLVTYWYNLLNNESTPREQVVTALVGLSALSEPVLLPVRSMAMVKDLTLIERSYLSLAASLIGDEPLARSLYRDLADTSSVLSTDQARSLKGIADEELVRQTAGALAIVSARLNDSASEEWARTLSVSGVQNPSSYFSLETVLYVSNRLPYLKGGEQSFTWTYRGETTARTIARGDQVVFDLPTGASEQVVFGTSTGKIVAIARSEQPLTKTSGTPGYSVQREFWVNGVPTTTLSLGDMVEVRLFPSLSIDSKNSAYDLTDMLPSGLSYLGQTYSWFSDRAPSCAQSYPYAVDGQEVKFFVYSDWSKVRPQGCMSVPYLSYKARVRGPGTYVAEPTILQSFSNPSVRGYGNSGSIIISTTTRVMSTSSAI